MHMAYQKIQSNYGLSDTVSAVTKYKKILFAYIYINSLLVDVAYQKIQSNYGLSHTVSKP